jgi:Tc toxin complex TcA C-terminal TcB-binding domain
MYDLALHATCQAQYKFNLERGHTARRFLRECSWDNLHDGLMAGERLSAALREMEKAYLDENVREYELTKNFSLRLHFPMEFLRLKATGRCEINIPEWMFDLDYPDHYMRRIKSVALTIPCVTGPYTGVHCRLTLLSSMTRVDPRLSAPAHECCCPTEPCDCDCREEERLAREYEPCPDDPRIVRQYGAEESIATSTGQNDSGMFELNFNDSRYLPFEFKGAVSCWRIELSPDPTLSDVIVRMNLTSRPGGELLSHAAKAAAHQHLPGDGWCLFDVPQEFPDAWQLFRDTIRRERDSARLQLHFSRKIFPFVPKAHEIWINRMVILFEMGDDCKDDICHCPKTGDCPCHEEGKPAMRIVELSTKGEWHEHQKDNDCGCCISCFTSEKWPNLYCGLVKTWMGPLTGKGNHCKADFRFTCADEVKRVFILCRYTVPSACSETVETGKATRGTSVGRDSQVAGSFR